jgi:hypothetical protein
MFEMFVFSPCGSHEDYWVNGEQDQVRKIVSAAIGIRGYEQAYVAGEATLSMPGRWGHLGKYPREIYFHSVSDTAGKCP